jgi:hypothetical protein
MRVLTCVKLGNLCPRHSSTRASPRKNSQYLPGLGNLIRDIGAISGYIGCILLLGENHRSRGRILDLLKYKDGRKYT